MAISKFGISAALVLTVALAGCQSQRFAPMQTRAAAPAPLPAAPAGQVTTRSQLPPPSQPGMMGQPTDMASADPSQFPAPPGSENVVGANGQQVASLPGGATGGAPVTAGAVAGVWNASVSGQSCRIATPQTRFGEGFRAGPLRCPAPLDGVRSWNVSGNQLQLFGDGGDVLARLSSSGGERFDGQTSSGVPVSLSR